MLATDRQMDNLTLSSLKAVFPQRGAGA